MSIDITVIGTAPNKVWGKYVDSIDLTQKGGYALQGDWIKSKTLRGHNAVSITSDVLDNRLIEIYLEWNDDPNTGVAILAGSLAGSSSDQQIIDNSRIQMRGAFIFFLASRTTALPDNYVLSEHEAQYSKNPHYKIALFISKNPDILKNAKQGVAPTPIIANKQAEKLPNIHLDIDRFVPDISALNALDLPKLPRGYSFINTVAGILFAKVPNESSMVFLDALQPTFKKLKPEDKTKLRAILEDNANRMRALAQMYDVLKILIPEDENS